MASRLCLLVVGVCYFRQTDAREQQGDEQYEGSHDGVGHHGVAASLAVGGALEEETAHNECGEHRTYAVERLREVQTRSGGLLGSELRDIRVG